MFKISSKNYISPINIRRGIKSKQIIFFALFLGFTPNVAQATCPYTKMKKISTPYTSFIGVSMISLLLKDYEAIPLNLVLGVSYDKILWRPLKKLVKEEHRPCGCERGFPSGAALVYGWNAAFVFNRYGWKIGVPFYIASIALLYNDRIRGKAHNWTQVLSSMALSYVVNYVTLYAAEEYNIIGKFDMIEAGGRPVPALSFSWKF